MTTRDGLLAKAERARAAREAADRELADLHAAMLDEIAEAAQDGYMGKRYALDLLRGSFEVTGAVSPSLPDLIVEALCFYGRAAALMPPERGESVQQHARRLNEWIADKWRRERR